jgi:hypothetical protein
MSDQQTIQITERELREAELQMTGSPPTSGTAFIGFVPSQPPSAPVDPKDASSSAAAAPSDD